MPSDIKDSFTFQQGASVYHKDTHYVVIQIVDLEKILAQDVNTQAIKKLRISELTHLPQKLGASASSQIAALPDEDWQIAQQRLEIIQPLLHKQDRTRVDVEERAEKYGIHIATLYKWMKIYEKSGLITSLMPKKRKDAGTTRLNNKTEKIIESCIEDSYLTKQHKSISSLFNEIERQCKKANLPVPHCNTIRNRINSLSDDLKIRRRYRKNSYDEIFRVNDVGFSGANSPLSVVQIDHMQLHIILVDDLHRQPLDRPWITMAIDVFSRMVLGFYVSFDAPGAAGAGMCLAHAIDSKDEWLVNHEIATQWPCWGMPRKVCVDHTKEFQSNMLTKASQEYGFNIEWHSVAHPNYGGHIERLLGSFAQEIHGHASTAFTTSPKCEGYNSTGHSSLTLKEFEGWFTRMITEVYHQRLHKGVGCTPIKKYEEGILGVKNAKGVGLPARIKDAETLRINFLPYVERTIQSYGIVIDEIFYYHDVLRSWANCLIEGRSKLKRKFIFRRDPRDISIVWFFDPELKTYFKIPYRNICLPAITNWELNKIQSKLKDKGVKNITEDLIFSAYDEMQEVRQQAFMKERPVTPPVIKDAKIKHNALISAFGNDYSDDVEITPFDELLEVNY